MEYLKIGDSILLTKKSYLLILWKVFQIVSDPFSIHFHMTSHSISFLYQIFFPFLFPPSLKNSRREGDYFKQSLLPCFPLPSPLQLPSPPSPLRGKGGGEGGGGGMAYCNKLSDHIHQPLYTFPF